MTEGLAFEPADPHDGCPAALRKALATACANMGEPDMDLIVSTQPPIVRGPGGWRTMPATCPHGTTFWIEPTGDQRAKWAQEARHS